MHYVSPSPTMGIQHTVVYEIKQLKVKKKKKDIPTVHTVLVKGWITQSPSLNKSCKLRGFSAINLKTQSHYTQLMHNTAKNSAVVGGPTLAILNA